jgi:FdhD protein
MLMFIEDVGRHNAVDAIAGRMWLEGLLGDDLIFYTTGRLTSEMVIKGAQMGIPFLLSRSGVTQMGLDMARRVNLSLFGRCSGEHFLIYSGIDRFIPSEQQAV